MPSHRDDVAVPKFVLVGFGTVLVVVALLLTIAVFPILLFPRDSRDLTGGVAGTVVILLMGLAGIYLIFGGRTTPHVARIFYFVFGGLGVVVGIIIVASAIHAISTGRAPAGFRPRMIFVFLVPFAVAIDWLRRGFTMNLEEDDD